MVTTSIPHVRGWLRSYKTPKVTEPKAFICPKCGGGYRGEFEARPAGTIDVPKFDKRTGLWGKFPHACDRRVDPWTREDQQIGGLVHCGGRYRTYYFRTKDGVQEVHAEKVHDRAELRELRKQFGRETRPLLPCVSTIGDQVDTDRQIVLQGGMLRGLEWWMALDLWWDLMDVVNSDGNRTEFRAKWAAGV